MRWKGWWIGILFGMVLGVALPAAAQQGPRDRSITVLQPKPVLRSATLEWRPRLMSTVANPLVRQTGVGGSLALNLGERWYIAGHAEGYDFFTVFSGTTERYAEAIDTTATIPEVVELRWLSALEVGWVPFFGKFALFNRAIAYFDFYLAGSVGVQSATRSLSPVLGLAGGGNLYLTRWLGLNVEFRDRFSLEELSGGTSVYQTMSVALGVSFLMPLGRRTSAADDARGGR